MKAKGYIVTLLGSHTPIVKRPLSPSHYAPFAAPLRPFRRLTTPHSPPHYATVAHLTENQSFFHMFRPFLLVHFLKKREKCTYLIFLQ